MTWAEGSDGQFHFHLQNHGPEELQLAPVLVWERETVEGFREVKDSLGRLRGDCGAAWPEQGPCRPLAAGAELAPAPIYLRKGDMQCAEGAELPEGRYRLLVRGCHGEEPHWVSAVVSQVRPPRPN